MNKQWDEHSPETVLRYRTADTKVVDKQHLIAECTEAAIAGVEGIGHTLLNIIVYVMLYPEVMETVNSSGVLHFFPSRSCGELDVRVNFL